MKKISLGDDKKIKIKNKEEALCSSFFPPILTHWLPARIMRTGWKVGFSTDLIRNRAVRTRIFCHMLGNSGLCF